MNHDNVFVFIVRTCMIDTLFEFLKPTGGLFGSSDHVGDLFEMMGTCKNMKDMMIRKMIKMTIFKSSSLCGMGDNATYIQNLWVDDFSILSNNTQLLSNVQQIIIDDNCDPSDTLKAEMFPAKLKGLIFGYMFNQYLNQDSLPRSLKALKFGWDHGHEPMYYTSLYNKPLKKDVLPEILTYLELSSCFNHPIDPGILPLDLKILIFGPEFNQPIGPGVLPCNLKKLKFGICFNQKLEPGVLPDGLKKLYLNQGYNQDIEPGTLPSGLKCLTLRYQGSGIRSSSSLPSGLSHLTFLFGESIQINQLPSKLVKLTLNNKTNIFGKIPDSLVIEYI